jgi:acid stress-induced BolA-like protein IbaG/YrbA
MHPNEVKKLLESHLENATVYVDGDGHHFDAVIVATLFEGLSRIQRQQAVYAKIGNYITDGTIHALSFKTLTPAEWEASQATK